VATLVSAIVVVLWGIKIFYSVWTGRKSRRNLHVKAVRDKGFPSAAAEACRSNCPAKRSPGTRTRSAACRASQFSKSVAEKIQVAPTSAGTVENHWRRLERGSKFEWSGFDIRYPVSRGPVKANVKSTSLEAYICWWSFDSNFRRDACGNGMRILESDH